MSESQDLRLHRLALFAAALWWGGQTAISFVAVPTVFRWVSDKALAAQAAAQLFAAQVWLVLGCALVLLLCQRAALARAGGPASPAQPAAAARHAATAWILLGMLLALVQQYAVSPRIQARVNPMLWHNLGTALVVAQWLCAAALLWRMARPAQRQAQPPAG